MIKCLTLFNAEFPLSAGQVEEFISKKPIQSPSPMSMASSGWQTTTPEGAFVYAYGDDMLLTYAEERRILPADAVKREVEKEIAAYVANRNEEPSKKERGEIKRQVIDSMLPNTLTKRTVTPVWVRAGKGGFVAVGTTSQSRAEIIRSTLMRALSNDEGATSVVTMTARKYEMTPGFVMTQMLKAQSPPAGFALGDECVLVGTGEDAATIRFSNANLREATEHTRGGMGVKQMGLQHGDDTYFVLNAKGQLSKISVLNVGNSGDVVDEGTGEVAAAEFGADFVIYAGTVGKAVNAMKAFLPEVADPQ